MLSLAVSLLIALVSRENEHRLTSLEERSFTKDEIAKINQSQTVLTNIEARVNELCADYKEMIRMIYQDLPVALKKNTTRGYDSWLDKLTTFVDNGGNLKPNINLGEAKKIYKLVKVDYMRSLKTEDMGRQVMTKLILRRMERDFGFGEDTANVDSKKCL